ncbi:MAG TPA: hypothetical protein VJU34_07345, partial [Phenylobacterium sp.]|nr:hypothetical protein [Phenylobacterium sp.]
RDAKNSILLWIGTVVFFSLFWAARHFDVTTGVPDLWLWPALGVVIIVNVFQSVWSYFRKRKA